MSRVGRKVVICRGDKNLWLSVLFVWEFSGYTCGATRSGRRWSRPTTGWWRWRPRRTTTWRICSVKTTRPAASRRTSNENASARNVSRPKRSTSALVVPLCCSFSVHWTTFAPDKASENICGGRLHTGDGGESNPHKWTARNLAYGILILSGWLLGVSECRWSSRVCASCAVCTLLQISSDRGHLTNGAQI